MSSMGLHFPSVSLMFLHIPSFSGSSLSFIHLAPSSFILFHLPASSFILLHLPHFPQFGLSRSTKSLLAVPPCYPRSLPPISSDDRHTTAALATLSHSPHPAERSEGKLAIIITWNIFPKCTIDPLSMHNMSLSCKRDL